MFKKFIGLFIADNSEGHNLGNDFSPSEPVTFDLTTSPTQPLQVAPKKYRTSKPIDITKERNSSVKEVTRQTAMLPIFQNTTNPQKPLEVPIETSPNALTLTTKIHNKRVWDEKLEKYMKANRNKIKTNKIKFFIPGKSTKDDSSCSKTSTSSDASSYDSSSSKTSISRDSSFDWSSSSISMPGCSVSF